MAVPECMTHGRARTARSRTGLRVVWGAIVVIAALFVGSQGGTARAAGAEVHVAVTGKDENGGSAAAPVATLSRAQALAREAGRATVVVHGGTWFLDEALVFTAADSGCTWRAADGAKPILSGGRTIGGWVRKEGGVWSARVPDAYAWSFRGLFVDGTRAVRARFPNRSAKDYALRGAAEQLSKDANSQVLTVDPKYLADWKNLNDVEVVVNINWASFHKRIQAVERETGRITLMPPHAKYWGRNRPTSKRFFWFENAREMLDEPGEWYLDRAGRTLFYMPREGEDLAKAQVVAPRLEHVVLVRGTAEAPVRDLSFRGLTFAHNGYALPDIGHHGRQACFQYDGDAFNGLPAMVQGEYLENGSFVGCTFTHGGSNGIELRAGCRGNVIEGNHVHDMAGNGIGIGYRNEEKTIPEKNRIANNYVHDCGTAFLGACGIWVGFARETVIAHNLVTDLPYTGISVGWEWKGVPTLVRDNVIEWNHVHDVMREVSDGGAVYTLGFQPGTVIRNNHLHDVKRGRYAHQSPNPGLYFDAGSKGFLVKENLVYRASGGPTRFKGKPEDYTLEGNVFGAEGAEDKAALPGVRAGAGLEEKWAKLRGE
ncbi:MAG: right-handed parallel beta-helix repeat-containing protein [Phycisphaerae bacterium]|nr:right-handed parallel beta-helix repeat-containing protein [Tepidisphaeraceae bacterium]